MFQRHILTLDCTGRYRPGTIISMTRAPFLPRPAAGPFVAADPISGANRDRTIVVYLTPEAVVIDYRLESGPV